MISKRLEESLNQALRNAQERRHEYATVEHLLLALLDNPEVSTILEECGCDLQVVGRDLEAHLDEHVPSIPQDDPFEITPTLGFQRVIQRAVFQVQAAGKNTVSGYVLVAIFGEPQSHAAYFLARQDITKLDVQSALSHSIYGDDPDDRRAEEEDDGELGREGGAHQKPHKKIDPLKAFTVNLNEKARNGEIDPLIGREKELQRIMQILCRRRKHNPLLVGDSGVGKTHLAEGLALKVEAGEIPEILQGANLFALDMGLLLAGTKFRGDFEGRLKGVIKALKKIDRAILFIDEIHTVIGAGSTTGGSMDASNLLKPMLASGDLRCIGSTTHEEFRGIFEKDRALARRFQKLDVSEPSLKETVQILNGVKGYYEEHHAVRYTHAAIRLAAELSQRHISDRKHPDSAIDVIDEAGAAVHLMPPSRRKKSIGAPDIEKVVASMAKIPPRSVNHDDRDRLRHLGRNLRLVLFGQDKAVDRVCEAIKLSRAGLGEPDKPVGAFLFTGPTGVGKTELARQLGTELGVELIRFDMSEKAHPDVFNLLLQVMDHGTLTDNNGRSADFKNVILIMTTNAGAQDLDRPSVGFVHQNHAGDDMKEIKRLFSPEFRNRLDAIVPFGPLEMDAILQVVDKFLVRLETQLAEKKVSLDVDEAARAWLGEHGHDRKNGARPMERLIKNKIRRALADALLFGALIGGGEVTVRVKEDKLDLTMRSADEVKSDKEDQTSVSDDSKPGNKLKRKTEPA